MWARRNWSALNELGDVSACPTYLHCFPKYFLIFQYEYIKVLAPTTTLNLFNLVILVNDLQTSLPTRPIDAYNVLKGRYLKIYDLIVFVLLLLYSGFYILSRYNIFFRFFTLTFLGKALYLQQFPYKVVS